jgi:hypothetical protein
MTHTRTYIIGDLHGYCDRLAELLRRSGLVAADLTWAARDATLWFMGDFFDRGPDGIACLEVAMRLQREAAAAGGRVGALIGNHELALIAAHRFGTLRSSGPTGTFVEDWRSYGGNPADLQRLRPHHIRWIGSLPAMTHLDGRLLLHADALLYTDYGRTADAVNEAISAIVAGGDPEAWDALLHRWGERRAFLDTRPGGRANAEAFLQIYGGRQLIHGHTPICMVTSQEPTSVRQPLVYAGGLCVNVDGGLYLGGPGFVYRLASLGPA